MTLERQVELSERAYRSLLLLYPRRFRVRFGPEMAQIFGDCCRMQAEYLSYTGVLTLWTGTLKDLSLSIAREWHRETVREDSEVDFTGLADACSVGLVVGTLLLGWGWLGAQYAMDIGSRHNLHYAGSTLTAEGIILGGIMTISTAILVGAVSALLVSTKGRRRSSFLR